MKLTWPDSLGDPPRAWTWYTDPVLLTYDMIFKLDSADAVIVELVNRLEALTWMLDKCITDSFSPASEVSSEDDRD